MGCFVAIDGNSLLNRAYYGVKHLCSSDGFPTNAIYGFFNVLKKVLNELNPDFIMVAFDLKAKTFRHKQFARYKANRSPMPEDLFLQLVEIKKMLTLMGIVCCEKEGYEADDLLGTVADLCTQKCVKCYIASGDRDVLQLVNSFVHVRLSTNRKEIWFNEEKVIETFGVSPAQLVDVKALMGDSADNIPGVRGIGEKTAFKLIKLFGSVEYIFKNLSYLTISARVKQILSDTGAEQICFLSKKLGKIVSDVDLNQNLSFYKRKAVDWNGLKSFLEKFELKTILNSITKENFLNFSELKLEPSFVKKELPRFVDENLNIVKKKLEVEDFLHFLFHNDDLFIVTSKEVFHFVRLKFDAFKNLIVKSNKPKKTINVKEIYKFCLNSSLELSNVIFSCDIAAYLVDVLEKHLDVLSLTEKFCASSDYLSCFCNLCTVLEQQLVDNGLKKLFFEIELPLTLVLAEMEICGFCVDAQKLQLFGEKIEEKIEIVKNDIWDFCGEKFNINSTKELSNTLFNKLKLPKTRKTKTGYSTDVQALTKLLKYSTVIEKILNYRTLAKLLSTYVRGFQRVLQADSRVHSIFKQTNTRTGRISSTEPNIQNIPIKTVLGSEMRKFFVAESGKMLVDCDYSQIELRILAEISNDEKMISAFIAGDDIHNLTATKLFGCDLQNVPEEFRRRSKIVNFSVVYGISPFSLAQDLGVTVIDAKNYIDSFFEVYSGVKRYFDKVVELAKKTGEVRTMFGRIRKIPELKSKSKSVVSLGERIAKNTPIQGSCADLIKVAMIKIRKRLHKENLRANLILQVHDELLVEVEKFDLIKVSEIVKEEMETVLNLKVPLVANVAVGKTWFDCKKKLI